MYIIIGTNTIFFDFKNRSDSALCVLAELALYSTRNCEIWPFYRLDHKPNLWLAAHLPFPPSNIAYAHKAIFLGPTVHSPSDSRKRTTTTMATCPTKKAWITQKTCSKCMQMTTGSNFSRRRILTATDNLTKKVGPIV